MTGFGVLQAGCKARRSACIHDASQCSGWDCPLYIVTTGNWSSGVRVFWSSVVFPQMKMRWSGYNSVSNKWNDLGMHSVVIKAFEAFWHIPLKRGHLGGTRVAGFWACREKQLHQPHAGREGGFCGKQSILLFWKAHNRATNLNDDFSSSV